VEVYDSLTSFESRKKCNIQAQFTSTETNYFKTNYLKKIIGNFKNKIPLNDILTDK